MLSQLARPLLESDEKNNDVTIDISKIIKCTAAVPSLSNMSSAHIRYLLTFLSNTERMNLLSTSEGLHNIISTPQFNLVAEFGLLLLEEKSILTKKKLRPICIRLNALTGIFILLALILILEVCQIENYKYKQSLVKDKLGVILYNVTETYQATCADVVTKIQGQLFCNTPESIFATRPLPQTCIQLCDDIHNYNITMDYLAAGGISTSVVMFILSCIFARKAIQKSLEDLPTQYKINHSKLLVLSDDCNLLAEQVLHVSDLSIRQISCRLKRHLNLRYSALGLFSHQPEKNLYLQEPPTTCVTRT
jgi:hypothetical protein